MLYYLILQNLEILYVFITLFYFWSNWSTKNLRVVTFQVQNLHMNFR
jgi:hypothetical protein